MKVLCVPALVILALVFAAVPLSAHHSWPVSKDRLVTVKGTVVEFAWANPHPMITLEVQSNDGRAEKWMVGGPAINRMTSNGWSKTTLKPGDVITGIGYQYADGEKIIRLERVVLPNGKELRVYGH
ncbi:MAG TPA: DUF6152 family protein [Bryobacteraceae bacterium]|nr:DUF6152 family protein [Bryobacteraceae bacterium]